MDKKEATEQLFKAAESADARAAQAALDAGQVALRAGANVNGTNSFRETPLHRTASSGNVTLAAILIAKGANINAKDEKGYTPLHYAASRGNEDVAALLIDKGADITAPGTERGEDTPLRWAVANGHSGVAKLLEDAANQQGHAVRDNSPDARAALAAHIANLQQRHAARVTEERKDKGPPQVGG